MTAESGPQVSIKAAPLRGTAGPGASAWPLPWEARPGARRAPAQPASRGLSGLTRHAYRFHAVVQDGDQSVTELAQRGVVCSGPPARSLSSWARASGEPSAHKNN